MTFGFLGCCGIKEILGLREWNEDRFFHLMHLSQGYIQGAWVCFNGRDDGGYVQTFRKFILANNLGSVVDLPKVVNPNSSNLLDIGMWQVNRDALRTWYVNRLNAQNNQCNCSACRYERGTRERVAREQAAFAARYVAQNQAPIITAVPFP